MAIRGKVLARGLLAFNTKALNFFFVPSWFKKKEKFMAVTYATMKASDIQTDYMKLLVTQLQNQNPLEPLSNSEMASQLAQLSQLGQIESLNSKFSDVLSTVQLNYASSLVGKQVAFNVETEDGEAQLASGVVEEVQATDNGINLLVNGYPVGLNDILAIGQAGA
jgi:flagellar basal-body rod modification protein FlgD